MYLCMYVCIYDQNARKKLDCQFYMKAAVEVNGTYLSDATTLIECFQHVHVAVREESVADVI
jgi:hypothetical protein